MLKQRKSIKRKQIKEDKLVTSYYNVIDFYNKYKSNINIISIVVAVIIIAAFFYFRNQGEANSKAGIELAEVMPVYDEGSYLEAIEGRPGTTLIGLKAIVEEYGSSENGETAKIYLGNAYYYLGKIDEALAAYDDYSGDNPQLKATGYAGVAACYEKKEDFESAAEYYLKAADVSDENILTPRYLVNAGINLLKTGKNEEAEKYFKQVKSDYGKSVFVKDIDRYIAQAELENNK